jgi:glycosidase
LKTKNIFSWLDEITLHKSPAEEFTDKDWDNFNSYMVHRFISMNLYYAELANIAQSLMPNNKKEIYNFYKEMIPKRKSYFKYIKSKNKQPNKNLIEKITSYFKVGSSEASSYIDILDKKELTNILNEMGVDDKEKKKLLK